jgi:hypothetical protein
MAHPYFDGPPLDEPNDLPAEQMLAELANDPERPVPAPVSDAELEAMYLDCLARQKRLQVMRCECTPAEYRALLEETPF